jgi:hypothetical protein
MGFEPTIPVFKKEKAVHASDCAATVIGTERCTNPYYMFNATYLQHASKLSWSNAADVQSGRNPI